MSLPPGRVIEDDPPVKPAGNPVSPFEGRLAFTAHDPASAGRLKGLVDSVILKADGGDRADPSWSPQLRETGFRVLVWEAENQFGQAAVELYQAEGWIGQAESEGQLESALTAGKDVKVPKALVSNITSFDVWPAGWYCLGESYANVDPGAAPDRIEYEARKRGAAEFSPVFGTYDPRGEQPDRWRISLEQYLTRWPYKDWALYLAETLTDADVTFLQGLA